MALKLIYQIFTKLLSWMVLHARSDTANEIEVLVLRSQLTVMAAHLHGSPRTVEKHAKRLMTKTATTRRTHLVAATRVFDDGGGGS